MKKPIRKILPAAGKSSITAEEARKAARIYVKPKKTATRTAKATS